MYNDTEARTLTLPDIIKPLEDGVWMDDTLIDYSDGRVIWYSFDITDGNTYHFWSNIGGSGNTQGNGLKTTVPDISAYYSDGVEIFKNFRTSGSSSNYPYWNNPQKFLSTSDDTVYVRVAVEGSSTAGGPGTFGIVYTENNSTRPVPPFNHPEPVPLTKGEWIDDEITSDSNFEAWYSFTATAGTNYYFWLNDDYDGDKTKSLNIQACFLYTNGTFATPNNQSTYWNRPFFFTPASSGTILVRVTPRLLPNTGTFGIVYDTVELRPETR
jgi:hypothetical protein